MGGLQVQPELMAADSVRMEVDGGGGDDSAMPLLDNFDTLEKVVHGGWMMVYVAGRGVVWNGSGGTVVICMECVGVTFGGFLVVWYCGLCCVDWLMVAG